jgi:hypothetical protein
MGLAASTFQKSYRFLILRGTDWLISGESSTSSQSLSAVQVLLICKLSGGSGMEILGASMIISFEILWLVWRVTRGYGWLSWGFIRWAWEDRVWNTLRCFIILPLLVLSCLCIILMTIAWVKLVGSSPKLLKFTKISITSKIVVDLFTNFDKEITHFEVQRVSCWLLDLCSQAKMSWSHSDQTQTANDL